MGAQLRSEGAFSQLRNEGVGLRNGTRVPRGGFATKKLAAKWGLGCEIGIFKALGISQSISQLRNEEGSAKWHSCAKGVFRRGWLWGYEIISQWGLNFVANP